MKKYAVDVHWDVARSFEIDAKSRKEAEDKIWKMITDGKICVWTDCFEATDDIEVSCSGEANEQGEIEYF